MPIDLPKFKHELTAWDRIMPECDKQPLELIFAMVLLYQLMATNSDMQAVYILNRARLHLQDVLSEYRANEKQGQ